MLCAFFRRRRRSRGYCLIRLLSDGLRLYQHARLKRTAAVDDNLVTGLQSFGDEPVIAMPVAGDDRARLRFSVLPDDPDDVSPSGLANGPLRHQNRIGANKSEDA